MKRLMILCVAVLLGGAFTACEKDDKGQLDPNAMISLRPAEGVKAAAVNTQHLTAKEIVEQAQGLNWKWGNNAPRLSIDDWNRDFIENRIKVGSTAVIAQNGDLTLDFIEGRNFTFITWDKNVEPLDTVAYIPNKVMQTAEAAIKAAYAQGDYTACYALFDKAFTYLPITGAEYLALEAKGEN